MACTYIKNLSKPVLSLLLLLVVLETRAQKEVQFSQFSLNQLFFNPATAGSGNIARVGVLHRAQYAGYQPTLIDEGGAPSTQLLTASVPFGNFGVGFYAMNDRIGALTQQDIQISGSYRFPLAGGNFSIGARAGLYRQALDYDKLRPVDPDDPLIPTGTASEIQPDFGLGIYFENNRFYAGLSSVHLSEQKFKLGTGTGSNPLARVYYFNAGVHLPVGYLLEVQPIVLVKAIPGSISAEGGALVSYDKRFFAGATYRHQDALAIVHAGASLLSDQSLRLSGSYDFVAGGNRIKSPTSYEVMLSYAFAAGKTGKKSIIRTPRFRF